MFSDISKLFSSGSAAPPARPSQDSSAARPAGGGYDGKDGNGQDGKSKDGAILPCLFARLPSEIWRPLVGLLSYSDVAAWACCSSHKDTEQLLLGYMRRRCCISTFKRLLVEYEAITPKGIAAVFLKIPEERKHFWKRAIEIIFTYESKFLLEDQPYQRCDTLTQQDYIHSCGVLFASEAFFFEHRQLQRQFRASYGAGYGVLNRADYWFRYRGFQYCLKGLNPDEHTVLDGLLL